MTLYNEIKNDLDSLGYSFRINDLDESVEVRRNNGWERITDTLEAVLKTDLRCSGYGGRKKPSLGAAKDAWTSWANEQRYNPIQDYFLSLAGRYEPSPPEPYINQLFAKFFVNPDGMFGPWLFRFMVGAIAKVFEGQRNPMLVLISDQHLGKSYLARWLCPIDPNRFFVEKGINPDSKDDKLKLADHFLWEVPELGATTRREDIEALKAFITTRDISERPPYGRYPIHKRAACSFIGSVNDDGAGFLNDPTGSTRFLACELTDINQSYTIHKVDDLWAEAYWFYKHSPRAWQLTDSESIRRNQINSSYEIVSALDDVVLDRFTFTGSRDDYMTTEQIKNLISDRYSIRNETGFLRELSRVVKRHGGIKARGKYTPGQEHKRGFMGLKPKD